MQCACLLYRERIIAIPDSINKNTPMHFGREGRKKGNSSHADNAKKELRAIYAVSSHRVVGKGLLRLLFFSFLVFLFPFLIAAMFAERESPARHARKRQHPSFLAIVNDLRATKEKMVGDILPSHAHSPLTRRERERALSKGLSFFLYCGRRKLRTDRWPVGDGQRETPKRTHQ